MYVTVTSMVNSVKEFDYMYVTAVSMVNTVTELRLLHVCNSYKHRKQIYRSEQNELYSKFAFVGHC